MSLNREYISKQHMGGPGIDGENYQTYCNDGSSPCSSSNVFNGGSLNSREKYYCYVKFCKPRSQRAMVESSRHLLTVTSFATQMGD